MEVQSTHCPATQRHDSESHSHLFQVRCVLNKIKWLIIRKESGLLVPPPLTLWCQRTRFATKYSPRSPQKTSEWSIIGAYSWKCILPLVVTIFWCVFFSFSGNNSIQPINGSNETLNQRRLQREVWIPKPFWSLSPPFLLRSLIQNSLFPYPP